MTRTFEQPTWEFPWSLVFPCESFEKFNEAKKILTEKHRFVESPFDGDLGYITALVLPRKDVIIEDIVKNADPKHAKGWGIGRVRFYNEPLWEGMTYYAFRYFIGDCPCEFIETDPMREAVVEIYKLIKPLKTIARGKMTNHLPEEIPFPYMK